MRCGVSVSKSAHWHSSRSTLIASSSSSSPSSTLLLSKTLTPNYYANFKTPTSRTISYSPSACTAASLPPNCLIKKGTATTIHTTPKEIATLLCRSEYHTTSPSLDFLGWIRGKESAQEKKDKEKEEISAESEADQVIAAAMPNALITHDWSPVLKLPIESFLTGEDIKTELGVVLLNPNVFLVNIRTDILHRVVVWQLTRRRQGTARTKSRAEVSGGGKKPWRQKGTGRARHGSIRSPIWRGGGDAHAVRQKDFDYPLPKRIRKMGLRVALSMKYAQGKLRIIRNTELDTPKTKVLSEELIKRGWESALIVDGAELRPNFFLASRNLQRVKVVAAHRCTVFDIMTHEMLILTLEGLELLERSLLDLNGQFYDFEPPAEVCPKEALLLATSNLSVKGSKVVEEGSSSSDLDSVSASASL